MQSLLIEVCIRLIDKVIWKWKILVKIQCFMWHDLQGSLKTWENLIKRGWEGPSLCYLGKCNCETTQHILVECGFTQALWHLISLHFQMEQVWEVDGYGTNVYKWKILYKYSTYPSFGLLAYLVGEEFGGF